MIKNLSVFSVKHRQQHARAQGGMQYPQMQVKDAAMRAVLTYAQSNDELVLALVSELEVLKARVAQLEA